MRGGERGHARMIKDVIMRGQGGRDLGADKHNETETPSSVDRNGPIVGSPLENEDQGNDCERHVAGPAKDVRESK
jgi:hypothetical protein